MEVRLIGVIIAAKSLSILTTKGFYELIRFSNYLYLLV